MHIKDSALTASCWLHVNSYLQLHCDNTTEHCDKVVIPREITANQLTNEINARIKKAMGRGEIMCLGYNIFLLF